MKLTVGTRGSQLALTQTNWVVHQILSARPDWTIDIKIIRTKGDEIQHLALDKIGDKGLFVAQIEEALLKGEIDFAVHSMKDMPSTLTPGLKFAPPLVREDARDILVLRESALPKHPIIGTGSKRRKYQLLSLFPDADIQDIRGNVDTRLSKLYKGSYDGIVLAAAGLKRLGIKPEFYEILSVKDMLPAPAQGVLAIQLRESDPVLDDVFEDLKCPNCLIQVLAERSFLAALDGSCHKPIGAYAAISEDQIHLRGLFGDEHGKHLVKESMTSAKSPENAQVLGKQLAERILVTLESLMEASDDN
jgi:hydroxymethylbilane synthase